MHACRSTLEDPTGLAGVFFWQGRLDLVPGAAQKALELNPNDLDGHTWMGNYNILKGDYRAAERHFERALQIDPLFLPAHWNLAEIEKERGNTTAALERYRRCLEQDPENHFTLAYFARLHMSAGNLDEARQVLQRVPASFDRNYHVRMMRGLLLALDGRADEARRTADESVMKFYGNLLQYAIVVSELHAALGDVPAALDWLERIARAGDERVEFFGRDPLLARLRGAPQFQQILESTDLRRAQRATTP